MLSKKFDTKLKKVESFSNRNILAQFDPNTNTILYKDDVTEYFIAHEHFHAEEMHKIGFDDYVKDGALSGSKFPDDYTTENLLRSFKREKYVHDQIEKHAKMYNFNSLELRHNYFNLDLYQFHLEKRNIKIPE